NARAFQLAEMANKVAPDEPHVEDTLGWLLVKRGDYQRAVTLLKDAVEKLPQEAGMQYHFGIASQHIGDVTAARQALTAAVNSPSSFWGKEDARKALAALK